MLIEAQKSILELIDTEVLRDKKITLHVKRDDLLHPLVSGNKWRKLKYNLKQVHASGKKKILSFGGAFSNHIYSLAAAGKILGMETIGVIRGEEFAEKLNPTLLFARSCGMKLHFISRKEFRKKSDSNLLDYLREAYGEFYLLPEGGSNVYALKGCAELVGEINIPFDYICCPCGTGGTLAGISSALYEGKTALGFSALKEEGYIEQQVEGLLKEAGLSSSCHKVFHNYHWGGYGKIHSDLIHFMDQLYKETGLQTDPVYTGKMFYGIFDLIKRAYFAPGSSIVAVHTGGLQGIAGMNEKMNQLRN
ncbi:MAG: 1-aminocyclopropane-1-carboxylate deaminase/D-cysteine desulfhydrase [Cytophagaceae bacterium]